MLVMHNLGGSQHKADVLNDFNLPKEHHRSRWIGEGIEWRTLRERRRSASRASILTPPASRFTPRLRFCPPHAGSGLPGSHRTVDTLLSNPAHPAVQRFGLGIQTVLTSL